MAKAKNKVIRYRNLIKRVDNWKYYIWKKMTGFQETFDFEIHTLGTLKVPIKMLSPFKENFLDDIYFRYVPKKVFHNKPKPTIIDIGGNVGYFTLATFAKFPEASIHAFEPHPYCFEILCEYQKTFSRYDFHIYRKAVSDQNGTLFLNAPTIDGFTTTTSVFQTKNKENRFSIESIQLGKFLLQEEIKTVDFMKLDCEGAEYAIVYSLPKKIFDNIESMCVETHKGKAQDENIDAMNKYLRRAGYETKILDEGGNTGYVWAWKPIYNEN